MSCTGLIPRGEHFKAVMTLAEVIVKGGGDGLSIDSSDSDGRAF